MHLSIHQTLFIQANTVYFSELGCINREHNVNTSNLIHTVDFSQLLVCIQREHNGGSTSHGANAPYSSKSLSFGYNPQFGPRLALLHKVNIKDLMSHGGLGSSEVGIAIVDLKIEWHSLVQSSLLLVKSVLSPV